MCYEYADYNFVTPINQNVCAYNNYNNIANGASRFFDLASGIKGETLG